MLDSIMEFFSSLFEPILSLLDVVLSFLSDVMYMIGLLVGFSYNLDAIFGFLPSPFVSSLVLVFGIVVIYKILGREG